MITRDQFEALVRAEAAKEYPFASAVGSMLSSRAIHRLEEFDDKAELKREAYIAARMEHEWPLVEDYIMKVKTSDERMEIIRGAEDALATLSELEAQQPKGELTYVMSKDAVGTVWPYLQHKDGCRMKSWANSMYSHAPISQRTCTCGLDALRKRLSALSSGEQPQQEPALTPNDAYKCWGEAEYNWPRLPTPRPPWTEYFLQLLREKATIYRSPQAPEPRLMVDQVMEFVKKWIAEMQPDSPIDPDEWNQPEWIKHESILRDRLTKAAQ